MTLQAVYLVCFLIATGDAQVACPDDGQALFDQKLNRMRFCDPVFPDGMLCDESFSCQRRTDRLDEDPEHQFVCCGTADGDVDHSGWFAPKFDLKRVQGTATYVRYLCT